MNINGRGSDSVILESQSQSCLVHQTSPSSVDEEGPGSHLLDGVLVDKMMIVFIESTVQRHAVRLKQQVLKIEISQYKPRQIHSSSSYLQSVDSIQSQGLLNTVRKVGIIEDHVETKCLCSESHC